MSIIDEVIGGAEATVGGALDALSGGKGQARRLQQQGNAVAYETGVAAMMPGAIASVQNSVPTVLNAQSAGANLVEVKVLASQLLGITAGMNTWFRINQSGTSLYYKLTSTTWPMVEVSFDDGSLVTMRPGDRVTLPFTNFSVRYPNPVRVSPIGLDWAGFSGGSVASLQFRTDRVVTPTSFLSFVVETNPSAGHFEENISGRIVPLLQTTVSGANQTLASGYFDVSPYEAVVASFSLNSVVGGTSPTWTLRYYEISLGSGALGSGATLGSVAPATAITAPTPVGQAAHQIIVGSNVTAGTIAGSAYTYVGGWKPMLCAVNVLVTGSPTSFNGDFQVLGILP